MIVKRKSSRIEESRFEVASRRAFKDDPSVNWTVCSVERGLLVPWTSEGVAQKSASWSARTRARKFDLRAAPHAAPGRSPTHVPLKKGPPGPRGPEHRKSTSGWHHTRPVGEVRRTCPSKKGRLVRADQRARNLRHRVPGVPSGVPCGEGRIEDEAAGRIEGRAALVTPRNSCPGPATLHLACTPTNGVPSARPLSPNHWGEGSGRWHQGDEQEVGGGAGARLGKRGRTRTGWVRGGEWSVRGRGKAKIRGYGRYGPDTWVTRNAGDIGDSEPARSVTCGREIGGWTSSTSGSDLRDTGERRSLVKVTDSRDIGERNPAKETGDVRDMGDGGASVWAHALADDQPHG